MKNFHTSNKILRLHTVYGADLEDCANEVIERVLVTGMDHIFKFSGIDIYVNVNSSVEDIIKQHKIGLNKTDLEFQIEELKVLNDELKALSEKQHTTICSIKSMLDIIDNWVSSEIHIKSTLDKHEKRMQKNKGGWFISKTLN